MLALSGCSASPPQIVSLSPGNGATGVAADAPVRISFDHSIDQASLVPRLHVDPPIAGCDLHDAARAPAGAPCRLVWNQDSSSVTLEHRGAIFTPSTRYGFALDPGVRDPDGAENSLDHHWALTSASAPSVRNLTPSDGSPAVTVDGPLAVDFSAPMDPATTVPAITLLPSVPGTRVVPNTRDRSRFVVLPGRLLSPNAVYTLTVYGTATDDHGQALDGATSARFITARLGSGGHAAVLGRRTGPGADDPSAVLISGLGPAQPGDPPAAVSVLRSSLCGAAHCGTLSRGQPLTGYLAATVSPDGEHVAVIERDEAASPPAGDTLHLIDLLTGEDLVVAARASMPSWSPQGRRLAYATGDDVHVLTVASGADTVLPRGDPLDGPPVWSRDGTQLALPVRGGDGHHHADLADPRLPARYPLPLLQGDVSQVVFDPTGDVLAVRREGASDIAGTWTVRLRGGDASPRRLAADLTPITYADAGTLVAAQRPSDGSASLVRVSVGSGDVTGLPNGPAASDLASVTASASGRQLGFLTVDASGLVQAAVENADGSNPVPLTDFAASDGLVAVAVALGG